MKALVAWAYKNRLLALLFAASVIAGGLFAASNLPIDAVPDVTNTQVQVVTQAPALSATEVETQVTQPVERAMAGIPGLVQVRSVTKFGISLVTLVFSENTDVYFARAQVAERLLGVRDSIPENVGRPELGPIATGLGEIYMFELKSTGGVRSPEELRTIVDWQVAPRLRQVSGVIEVIGFGAASKQYRVTVDPSRLAAHNLSVDEIQTALEHDNAVSGGGYVERAGEQVVLRGDARFRGIEDIAATVVRTDEQGIPIRVGQIAEVDTGPALRQGAMTRDARGEVVGGSILMLKGSNSRDVVASVKQAIVELSPHLPAGVVIDPYYDRAEFINRVLQTVSKNLGEGALLVVLCLLLTLGTLRAGLVVAGAIPFAMLTGIIGLSAIGYGGNAMSLGAVDFGIVVEGTVVVIEHILTHLGPATRARRPKLILQSIQDVARPVVFGVVIVLLVFLPLATLEDVEGKMFRPVVYSLCFMLFGAMVYALVVVPALARSVFDGAPEPKEPLLSRWVRRLYTPVLARAVDRPKTTIGIAFAAAALFLGIGSSMGAEFLPRIFEGSFAIDVLRPPSISLTDAIALSNETELALKDAPEVKTVVSRIGRPDKSFDPAGPESSDVFVILKPRSEWRHGMTPAKLVDDLSDRLDGRVPATINAFSQPIEMRVNDLIAGVKGDLAIKVYGDDLETMGSVADKLRRMLASVPGASDVKMEVATGLPSVRVAVDRERAARLGVPPRSVLDVLTMSRAGQQVGTVREGERVFDLVLRIGTDQMNGADLARLPIVTQKGNIVPIALVADVHEESTVVQIGREQMRRRLIVQANVRGRDMLSFVKDAQARTAAIEIPPGVEIEWGGQFQNFNRAKTRLMLLVPIALAVIALMLLITFRSYRYVVVTILNLPFALAGGALALVVRGLAFSIPAGVGFIALCGVSVMNGVVMTTNLIARAEVTPTKRRVQEAALASLRAIVSTAIVAAVGFVPAAMATGTGAEVQRPLATVVIGGLLSSVLLSLPALPAMLFWVDRNVVNAAPEEPRRRRSDRPSSVPPSGVDADRITPPPPSVETL
jgi:cobalt-zinc-cadmium resistance protein CzcA